ncbi:carbon storage regulator, CsrA [Caminicella sporogenes DSM 14501]|uniref:Translational regulator CsrA n=1 Tax=Caminicella sporogenes DSM 14501 TaxID=1121266 RepID=A0A1M6Q2A5_9FIRM|nr:carbon storage regulator CsrA [Caminicella sporogenes]RKD23548.1 carbon storage regulator [Caminicella sporogenes]SHK14251.1 carbon storage regulator, CsrA [Caminicella sporogenes DSM 14501]
MLVLTRKKDESIIIDGKIEIKVISIEENKVKIGISAPKDIEIHRKEIYIQIQEENRQAASGKLDLKDIANIFKK